VERGEALTLSFQVGPDAYATAEWRKGSWARPDGLPGSVRVNAPGEVLEKCWPFLGQHSPAADQDALIGCFGRRRSIIPRPRILLRTGSGSAGGPILERRPEMRPIKSENQAGASPASEDAIHPVEGKRKDGVIYDHGTQPGDIDTTIRITPDGPAPPAELIADPNRRIYRGLDPTVSDRERVEVVHFARPGTYLVICAIPRHFFDGMFGFIKVLP
jgi:hypothetical protein